MKLSSNILKFTKRMWVTSVTWYKIPINQLWYYFSRQQQQKYIEFYRMEKKKEEKKNLQIKWINNINKKQTDEQTKEQE